MKAKILFLSVMVISLCSACSNKGTALFNGKDLSNWVGFVDPESHSSVDNVFSVQDGVINVTGKPNGYIRTQERYKNFTLSVEWRWSEGARYDSGIYVALGDEDRIWPKGIQMQMKDGQLGVLISAVKLLGVASEGPVCFKSALTDETTEKPIGEWNTTAITCKDNHYTATVNGILVNEADCEDTEGYIALQSEGGPIQFRNVYIKK
ncbi:3-keto-disaccharide hydrolase [Phocaeicola oris]|uniref:3-keto-disaccharide hydrolase n=1 Tax=Phocaeicola oris TaxID=2896850 RepID=UPI00234EA592|nr:DUF1080 domain-containing protein [Phocaeicola oris]MCE2617271.1 DUF1080 domain-containing protein [Phocaeicola oris]